MTFVFILTGLALFGLVHSWLAGQQLKATVRRLVGVRRYEAGYRLFYNALAVVMLAPLGLLIVSAPGRIIWHVDHPMVTVALNLLRLFGLAGLVASLVQIDLGRFVGTAQLRAYLWGEMLPLPDEPLQTRGLYGLVRHPLYLFSLLVLWPAPMMTEALLGFNIGATSYFVLGSRLEERRLRATFGEAYNHYQAAVPWLLPSIRRFTHGILRNDG